MLLPLSDAPNPGGRPFVTYGLIAANIVVYALVSLPLGTRPPDTGSPAFQAYVELVRDQLPPGVPLRAALANTSAYDLYVFEHGYKPAAPQLADLFYSLFLHGGFLHLFGNMLFLWIYGDNVEYRLGRLAYLLWYLATGVAATLFFAVFALDSTVPLVGASGAISGVLGFYFLWFPRNTVRLFVFLFPFFMNVVAVRARIVLGVYLLIDNVLPFLISTGGGGGGVAHGAHIGGFVAGIGGAWMIERWSVQSRKAGYASAEVIDGAPAPAVGAAIAQGDMAARGDGVLRAAGRPDAPGAAARGVPGAGRLARGERPRRRGAGRLSAPSPGLPAHSSAAAAHLGAGLVQLQHLGQVAPAYQHFLDALDLDPDADTAARARAALSQIAAHQKYNIGRPRG